MEDYAPNEVSIALWMCAAVDVGDQQAYRAPHRDDGEVTGGVALGHVGLLRRSGFSIVSLSCWGFRKAFRL